MYGPETAGRGNNPAVAPQEAILRALCTQIRQRIESAEDRVQNIDTTLSRLINPRPVGVGTATDNVKVPHSDTLESELQQILYRLSSHADHLHSTASDLSSAV
jgi:hypothetical protein